MSGDTTRLAQRGVNVDAAPPPSSLRHLEEASPPDASPSFSNRGGLGTYEPGLGRLEFLEREALESERSDEPLPDPESLRQPPDDIISF